MAQQQNRTERRAKGAGSAPAEESAASPMGRFKRMTKRLLGVTPAELRQQERLYQEGRVKRRRKAG